MEVATEGDEDGEVQEDKETGKKKSVGTSSVCSASCLHPGEHTHLTRCGHTKLHGLPGRCRRARRRPRRVRKRRTSPPHRPAARLAHRWRRRRPAHLSWAPNPSPSRLAAVRRTPARRRRYRALRRRPRSRSMSVAAICPTPIAHSRIDSTGRRDRRGEERSAALGMPGCQLWHGRQGKHEMRRAAHAPAQCSVRAMPAT